jgi:hypothetical protein
MCWASGRTSSSVTSSAKNTADFALVMWMVDAMPPAYPNVSWHRSNVFKDPVEFQLTR